MYSEETFLRITKISSRNILLSVEALPVSYLLRYIPIIGFKNFFNFPKVADEYFEFRLYVTARIEEVRNIHTLLNAASFGISVCDPRKTKELFYSNNIESTSAYLIRSRQQERGSE